jgi:hypothetical protein
MPFAHVPLGPPDPDASEEPFVLIGGGDLAGPGEVSDFLGSGPGGAVSHSPSSAAA